MKFRYLLAIALACLMLVTVPLAATATDGYPYPTAEGIVPTFFSDNDPLCTNTGPYAVSFRINWNSTLNTWEVSEGSPVIYDAGGVSVTTMEFSSQYRSGSPLRWMVDWHVDGGTFTGEIRVKGGNRYLTYDYTDNDGDLHLYAPMNKGGQWASISHITFCGYFTPEEAGCYQDETAWADGDPYNPAGGGNWAMYVTYEGEEKTVAIYAAQHMNAGTATFSEPDNNDNVTITIDLENGFIFSGNGVDDNLKVQDYASPPSGNPKPGQFNWKTLIPVGDTSGIIIVPENNFYGVHLDVAYLVDCV